MPAFSLRLKKKPKDFPDMPGPFHYNAKPENKRRAPTYVFGTASQRTLLKLKSKNVSPGPGDYKVPTCIGNQQAMNAPDFKFV